MRGKGLHYRAHSLLVEIVPEKIGAIRTKPTSGLKEEKQKDLLVKITVACDPGQKCKAIVYSFNLSS